MWGSFLATSFLFFCFKTVASSQRIGIIVDDEKISETHSIFFNYLKSNQDIVTVEDVTKTKVSLSKFGTSKYDSIILILTKKTKSKNSPSVKSILEHLDGGGNLVLITSSTSSLYVKELLVEFGFTTFDDFLITDHLNSHHFPDKTHNIISLNESQIISSNAIFDRKPRQSLYEGVGFGYNPENARTFPILTAPDSGYIYDGEKTISKYPSGIGNEIALVASNQMMNGMRITVVGSVSFFSDRLFTAPLKSFSASNEKITEHRRSDFYTPSDNQFIAESLIEWGLCKKGLLRISEASHVYFADKITREEYIVEDLIKYTIKVDELTASGWIPFDGTNLQLELYRMESHMTLTYNSTIKGIYTAVFHLPDMIGTFGLETRYKLAGYNTLYHQVKIIIRPRHHNHYERFLTGAMPYYLTSFLMMILVFLLTFIMLSQKSHKVKAQ